MIPESTRSQIRRLWLGASSRDETAAACHVSHSSVTNEIKRFVEELGSHDGEALRELAKNLKSFGISPAECALGLRRAISFRRIGLNERPEIEEFVRSTFDDCKEIGASTRDIASLLKDLAVLGTHKDEIPDRAIAFGELLGWQTADAIDYYRR